MPLTATAHFISRTYIVQFGLVEVSTHPHIVLGMFKLAAYVIQYLGGGGGGLYLGSYEERNCITSLWELFYETLKK